MGLSLKHATVGWACLIVLLTFWECPAVTAASSSSSASASRPNIVFILADDLGIGDISTYPSPSPKSNRLETPNIARLASEGLQFTDAYAGYSVCAPSRWTLMTGYHTGHGNVSNGAARLLNENSTTVASLLRKAGYTTNLIGKWGLDGNFEQPQPPSTGFPTKQGFTYYFGQSDQYQCHNYYPSFMFRQETNTTISQNVGASVKSCGNDYTKCLWSGDAWTQEATSFITSQASSEDPYFLYLAYTAPHAGSVGSVDEDDVPAPRVSSGPYSNRTWPKVEVDFATAVYDIDQAVGHVLDAIDKSGQANNTLVIFASDNGAHNEGGHSYQFFNSSGYLNGFKRSIHDGGHRTGMIVRWPGMTPAGKKTDHLFAFYDFLPTVADIVGIKDLPPSIDGHSAAPTFMGKSQEQPDFIYHEFDGCEDPICQQDKKLNCKFGQNIRYGNWSGVCVGPNKPCDGKAPGAFYLYDMSVDEGQTKNIAADHPSIAAKILDIMKQQYNKNWPPSQTNERPVVDVRVVEM